MIKKILLLLSVLLLLTFAVVAEEGSDLYEDEFAEIATEDIYEDIGDVELEGEAGMTPDSSFYFLESLVESVLVGDNPESALEYKEEKILELKEMVHSGNQEAAEKALEQVEKYNNILQKEVSPELDQRVRESSKAVKVILESFESELEGNEWDDVRNAIDQNMKTEDKIALAAKISNKISELCKALSALDPLQYSQVCKSDDNAPRWKRDLDRELTKEQEKEAKEFFEIMSECFEDPNECRCDDISIKPFADQCNVIVPLAAKCEAGDEDACRQMDQEDPIGLLPDYLQNVMEDIEDKYRDDAFDNHVPFECVEAGVTDKEECSKIMFKLNAPLECLEALESGKINPRNERESREQCDAIMFNAEAPMECIEAGLKDFRECDKYMFKLDAPQECLDMGLTGEGRDDWKKCDAIRFRLDAPQECLDAGIDGTHRDDWKKCEAIRFRLEAPQECLDAGLTGEGKDDWKKCNKITFLLDAPEECRQFADDRDPWKSCQPVQFKLDAPQECLDAGLDGTGRDDWKKCEIIRFKLEAPQECLDAGLTGAGRKDWDECNKIRKDGGDGCQGCGNMCVGKSWTCLDGNCVCEELNVDVGNDNINDDGTTNNINKVVNVIDNDNNGPINNIVDDDDIDGGPDGIVDNVVDGGTESPTSEPTPAEPTPESSGGGGDAPESSGSGGSFEPEESAPEPEPEPVEEEPAGNEITGGAVSNFFKELFN